MSEDRRYCPLHGDYLPKGRSSQCPECRVDPVGSSASLRQVRVVGEEQLDPEGQDDDQPTPLGERFDCPVCGSAVPAPDFRVEAPGEVWLGEMAVWAEEGVCNECYREVVSKNIREWTQAEWLVHHYEGWRTMVDSVHEIIVHEHSPQEAWLPEEERHEIVDLEATLAARREHLARCQMAMEELQGRYDATITPPPFQMTLASGSQALSEKAVAQLKSQREADLKVELELRQNSVYGVAPFDEEASPEDGISTEPSARAIRPPRGGHSVGSARSIWGRLVLALLIATVLIALGLLLVVSVRS